MKRSGLFAVLACICAILCVSAQPCLAAEKTIKIGAIDGLTGVMAPAEIVMHQGTVLAAEYINDNGGITIKGTKYKIELLTEDTKSSGEGTIAAANKLIMENNVKFVTGGVTTECNLAANSVTVPAGVLQVRHYFCLAPDEIGPNVPLAFSQSPGIVAGMRVNFGYLKEKWPNVKTLAAIFPADGGEAYREKYLRMVAPEFGLKVVYAGTFANDTTDFHPVVTKALEAKADAFAILDALPPHFGAIIKISRTVGYKGPLFCTNPSTIQDIIEAGGGGKEVEGFFLATWDMFDPKRPPLMAEVAKRGQAKFGKASYFQAFGFNTLYTLAQAMQSAQSLDPTTVANRFRTMKTIQTITGPGTMGGQKTFGINNIVCSPLAVVQVVNGKGQIMKWAKGNYMP